MRTTLDILAEVRGGVTKGRDLSRFETVEVPYLRVANVQGSYLDLSEVKTIQIKASELEKYKLWPNDVLFTEGGDGMVQKYVDTSLPTWPAKA